MENTEPNAENRMDEAALSKSDADHSTDEGGAEKSDAVLDSDHTVGYIVSTEEDDDDFDSSDEEPLSKYVVVKYSGSPELEPEPIPVTPGQPVSTSNEQRKRGRPRGRAKPRSKEYFSGFNIVQQHVRRDRVDEEYAERGIIYKKWEPLDPNQDSHPSVMDVADSTVIPDAQDIPEWCIFCLRDNTFAHNHYLRVNHNKLHVVNEFKMLSCKCSEIRSHGYDRSARNLHFHCYLCFHPFKVGNLLATHLITPHTEIILSEVRHLMQPENLHRNYDFRLHQNIRQKTSVFL